MLSTDTSTAISRLPNELLSMVFESFVATWEVDVNAAWGQLWRFLGVISLVSKHWNDVALRTPKIWRNIIYGDHSRRRRPMPGDLQMYLTRSAEAPLFLWIVPRHRLDLPEILAMPTRARVQHLHLYLGLLPDVSPGPLGMTPYVDATRALLQTTWPSLKHLSLTIVEHDFLNEQTLMEFLGRLDTLVSLHMEGWPSTPLGLPPIAAEETPTLPNLRTIKLHNVLPDDICCILSYIRTPQLRTLYLQLSQGETGFVPPVEDSFNSNLANVRDLTLVGGLSPTMMLSIFQLVPAATSLDLVFKNRQQPAWTQLGFLNGNPSNGQILLPIMHTLRIDHQLFWVGPLLPLIQSRVNSPFVATLRHLGVPKPFAERNGPALQPLRDLGVTVSAWVPEPIPYFLEKQHGKP